MNNENFFSKLLQFVALLSGIVVALSQYIFKESFRVFFKESGDLYHTSSLIALLISFIIIISVFANRFFLSSKFYFNKSKRDKWYRYLRKEIPEVVKEPFGITISGFAIVSIVGVIVAFFVFISTPNLIAVSISYVLLITLLIFSLSVFGIKLYLENDFESRQKRQEEAIQKKIKEFFIGEITIKQVFRDESNLGSPVTRMTILRGGEEYSVFVNSNDPNRYFYIEKNAPTREAMQKQIEDLLAIIANLQTQLSEVEKSGFETKDQFKNAPSQI